MSLIRSASSREAGNRSGALRWAWAALFLIVSGAAQTALAAPPAGEVDGVAKDTLERPLAGVRLRLEAPDGTVVGRTTSGANGGYRFTKIAPGIYSVVAEMDGYDTATAIASVSAGAGASADLTLASKEALSLSVTAKRLEEARNSIQPKTGASTYTITEQAIQDTPGGDNAPLNQVLLQAPGVTQDSFGQIHVRNEHANVQYRINGVILPEGVSFFGQSLTSRLASSIDLITGALPAEYGLRTAGIVDIQTKSGAFEPGGYVGLYGGSHGWLQPSAEYAGSAGQFNYYVAGDYLQNAIGIENPTPSYNAIHDNTQQGHGFAYLEDIIDSSTKLSAILGIYRGQFQIPNSPGQPGIYTVNGSSSFDSAALNEYQRELNDYAVLSYLKSEQDYDFQVSTFSRYSSIDFSPDPTGDLIFNGISQSAYIRDIANGLQAEGNYRLGAGHTLRGGVIIEGQRAVSETNSSVLPGSNGVQTSDVPFSIAGNSGKTGWTYSTYLQDEWQVTPTITVNYGGRFDVINEYTNENQLSPRINAVWKATPSTTFHAGYANYFTPPPFELVSSPLLAAFAGTTAAPGVPLNSAVKAERSQYFDIGVDQEILPGLKAGIDGYYKYARNLLDEGQFGAPIILTPFNYHTGRNLGVELTTSYHVGNFSYYGNLAIAKQKAEGVSSAQFNFSPAELAYIASNAIQTDHSQIMTASGGVSYLWRGTRFSVDMLAGSGLRTGFANTSSLPSYEQVNFGASHRFEDAPGGPVELRLDVINMFDEIYQIRSGTGIGVFAPQYGPRVSVLMGVRKEF